MAKVNYLKGFSEYTRLNPMFEMASELTKLGVPKDLMQFIHNLTGEKVDRVETWSRGGKFRTLAGEYGGAWPAYQDDPLSHDVKVIGTKTGKERVYNYLTSLPTDRDISLRLILVNPEEGMVHYITRQTGKTRDWKGYDPNRPEVSQKRGFYMRIITIDKETGEPVAAWRGTISQLLEDVTQESVLYIMEQEDRVKTKRETRKSYKMDADKFIDYFEDKYINIVNKALEKKTGRRREEFKELLQEVSPEDVAKLDKYMVYKDQLPESLLNVIKKATEISTGAVDRGLLKVELRKFLEYLASQGKYETDPSVPYDKVALLDDVIDKHSLMGTCSRFFQFIVTGKTASVAKDVFTELGIADLGLGDDFDF